MIKKTLAATAVVLTLGGASLALAQSNPPRAAQGPRFNTEDVAALTDARIAALKAGLKLTPEQEKNWPAVETAIRDLAKDRADRMKQRAERREARKSGDNASSRPDMIGRLRQGADAMTVRADSLKKLADAAEPLYKSLDDGQKRRFSVLLRAGSRSGGGWHHRWQRRADNLR